MSSRSGTWCTSRHRATTAPDNQSGVVVLDADKDYSFLKRISYDLPASKMPGPKISGITVSLPLQMLYVTSDGWMKAIDLTTDKVAWTFNGESAPVERTRAPPAAAASVLDAAGWQDAAGGIELQLMVVLHRRRHRAEPVQAPDARSERRP